MRCGLTAEDCAALVWSPKVHGQREGSGWRAPCPVEKCPTASDRLLRYSIRGKTIGWQSFCPHHDKNAMRPTLRKLLGDCLPGRSTGPAPIDHDDLIALMLSGMPPVSMKLAGLELAGMSTSAALDKLGVRREHRSRVIAARTGSAPKWVQNRRS